MSSEPDVSIEEIRLCGLLDRFEQMRDEDPGVSLDVLREEAGDLFERLRELVACTGALNIALDERDETLPLQIGPYRVDAWLGSGLSGEVYRARRGAEPPVAIKVLRSTFRAADKGLERFRREIRVVIELDDPHTVRVLDQGEDGDRAYVVMELVDGGSLATMLAQVRSEGPDWNAVLDAHGVPPAEGDTPSEIYGRRIAGLFAPAARALDDAASHGLVHRDLKPSNLLLTRDGEIRVADFGIAKIVGEEITSTLAYLGTPSFMSPEQARGDSRDVDERTDVYGLGATLYRALTLRYPNPGDTMSEMLAAIVTKVPERVEGYPKALADLVARCLEKRPDDRYQSLSALADDLERIARGERAVNARLPAPRRARRFAIRHRVAAGMIVLVAAGAWWLTRPLIVEFRVLPSEAHITLDGKDPGKPPWKLKRGTYTLMITLDGFETRKESIEIDSNLQLEKILLPKTIEGLRKLGLKYTPVASRGVDQTMPAFETREPDIDQAMKALREKDYRSAYEFARDLPDTQGTRLLKLQALDGLGLRGTKHRADLYRRYVNEK